MLFATYQPYCWNNPVPSRDYYSRNLNKDLIYCFSADTIENFIIGSMIIQPNWPEQLIFFEVRHFYSVNKIEHYRAITGPDGRYGDLGNKIFSSRAFMGDSNTSYQDFCDFYHSNFPKYKQEFLYQKDRIEPIRIIDIKNKMEKLCDEEGECGWRDCLQEWVDENFDAYNKGNNDPKVVARDRLKLTAQWYFDEFLINGIVNIANDIYNQSISMELDCETYLKLLTKFNKELTERSLDKLINYIKSSIKYKEK